MNSVISKETKIFRTGHRYWIYIYIYIWILLDDIGTVTRQDTKISCTTISTIPEQHETLSKLRFFFAKTSPKKNFWLHQSINLGTAPWSMSFPWGGPRWAQSRLGRLVGHHYAFVVTRWGFGKSMATILARAGDFLALSWAWKPMVDCFSNECIYIYTYIYRYMYIIYPNLIHTDEVMISYGAISYACSYTVA